VIKNVSTLFYDQPELLHGTDGLEFFVPKNCAPPKPSVWFEWTPGAHARYGRVSFRVAVRMLLLCEKRSRSQPPDLTRRKVRCLGDSDDGSSSEYSSSESESEYEDENGNMVKKEKEPGTVDEDKMPPIWDQVTERVLGEFEKMTLKIEPMTDDQCWEDATAQKEENERVADALGRGKRAKPDPTESPPESPPPPGGGQQRSRKSKRIIAKVNRGGQMQSYKHLISGRHLYMGTKEERAEKSAKKGRGRKSLIGGMTGSVAAMSTLKPDAPLIEGAKVTLVRDPKEMSLIQRPGLHQLPENCMERIIFFLAQAEGKEELHAQREALMKSLGKSK